MKKEISEGNKNKEGGRQAIKNIHIQEEEQKFKKDEKINIQQQNNKICEEELRMLINSSQVQDELSQLNNQSQILQKSKNSNEGFKENDQESINKNEQSPSQSSSSYADYSEWSQDPFVLYFKEKKLEMQNEANEKDLLDKEKVESEQSQKQSQQVKEKDILQSNIEEIKFFSQDVDSQTDFNQRNQEFSQYQDQRDQFSIEQIGNRLCKESMSSQNNLSYEEMQDDAIQSSLIEQSNQLQKKNILLNEYNNQDQFDQQIYENKDGNSEYRNRQLESFQNQRIQANILNSQFGCGRSQKSNEVYFHVINDDGQQTQASILSQNNNQINQNNNRFQSDGSLDILSGEFVEGGPQTNDNGFDIVRRKIDWFNQRFSRGEIKQRSSYLTGRAQLRSQNRCNNRNVDQRNSPQSSPSSSSSSQSSKCQNSAKFMGHSSSNSDEERKSKIKSQKITNQIKNESDDLTIDLKQKLKNSYYSEDKFLSKDSYGLQIASGTVNSGNDLKSAQNKQKLIKNNQSIKDNSPSLFLNSGSNNKNLENLNQINENSKSKIADDNNKSSLDKEKNSEVNTKNQGKVMKRHLKKKINSKMSCGYSSLFSINSNSQFKKSSSFDQDIIIQNEKQIQQSILNSNNLILQENLSQLNSEEEISLKQMVLHYRNSLSTKKKVLNSLQLQDDQSKNNQNQKKFTFQANNQSADYMKDHHQSGYSGSDQVLSINKKLKKLRRRVHQKKKKLQKSIKSEPNAEFVNKLIETDVNPKSLYSDQESNEKSIDENIIDLQDIKNSFKKSQNSNLDRSRSEDIQRKHHPLKSKIEQNELNIKIVKSQRHEIDDFELMNSRQPFEPFQEQIVVNDIKITEINEQIYFYYYHYLDMQQEYEINQQLLESQVSLLQKQQDAKNLNKNLFRELCQKQKILEESLEEFQNSTVEGQIKKLQFNIQNKLNENDELAEDIEELREKVEAVQNEIKNNNQQQQQQNLQMQHQHVQIKNLIDEECSIEKIQITLNMLAQKYNQEFLKLQQEQLQKNLIGAFKSLSKN